METLVELPDSQYLWLLGPQCLLLVWSYQLFLNKGWRGLHGPVTGVLFMLGFIMHFTLLSVVKVHEMEFWPEIGPVLYSLCFNLYQIIPLIFMTMLLFSFDQEVLDEFHRLRGLSNPNARRIHKGKIAVGLSVILLIVPGSLITAPLGLLWQHRQYHGILRGEVDPRGKGTAVLSMAIFAGTLIAACTAAAVALTVLQFLIIHDPSNLDWVSNSRWLASPARLLILMPWIVIGGPFAVLLVGGFIQQFRYGALRCVLGVSGILVIIIAHASSVLAGAPVVFKSSTFEVCGWFGLVLGVCLAQRAKK